MKRLSLDMLQKYLRDDKKKIAAISVLILAVLFIFAIFKPGENGPSGEELGETEFETEVTSMEIYVDIGGAVVNPKLAVLPEGSRVEDAILAAGGLSSDADMTSINRAAFLEDGEKIYIPSLVAAGDVTMEVAGAGGMPAAVNGKVNINTADSTQLQTLTGVGPATAQKIIDYRTANGRFASIEDIKKVSGIGDKTFEKFKDDITV